jgi:hypothetical protein
MSKNNNCPNCGAPLEPYKHRCDYCGSWYYDLTAFNLTDGKPCYIKFKTDCGTITALTSPELKDIITTVDTVDCLGKNGITTYRCFRGRHCDINVTFHTLIDHSHKDSLYTLEVEE